MRTSFRIQMIAMLAIGGLIGYALASRQSDLAGKTAAAEVTRHVATPIGQANGLQSHAMPPVCLTEPKTKASLLAVADSSDRVIQVAQADTAAPSGKKPNILFIMGDDVGWFNIGAYHRGIMSGKTPNLDKLAAEGMLFTDYYAEASCTAGRANFITGELPLRTGLTTVGQAGADVGLPDKACTLATALKAQGYTTGQFGKNHVGDLNKYLPTVHGFDEFYGYLYHLDAMSDPYWYSYPAGQEFYNEHGPRPLVHCYATDTDDATEMPRWGRVGKQRIEDEGPLRPFKNMADRQCWHEGPPGSKHDMETFDEELVDASCKFM